MRGHQLSPVLLRKMTDSIAHRGPDGEGFYIDNFIGLGHRRLAIIDLSNRGHQPMATKDKQFIITYNGEVYNFKGLRKELEDLGCTFTSNSDTEVILKSYMEWGVNCLNKLNGMFAFAIWDKTKQELFLARDRYGIKPLYYYLDNEIFIFASEQKPLLLHPSVKKEINEEGLLEYFTFQNIFSDATLVKGIKIFPAGSWTKIPLGSQPTNLKFTRYWDFNFREPQQALQEVEYIEELDRLFKQAVNRQLVSDVEIGSYLSGGMDSGGITALAAQKIPYLKSFTCGFDLNSASGMELAFDEREKAELMSYLFKTEHYEMVLKAGDMERIFSELAVAIEEPRVGQSYPNFYMAKLASKFVKVVLSGIGGDEIFAGYPWRYYRSANSQSFEHYVDEYYKFWQRLVPNTVIHQLFRPITSQVQHVHTREIFKSIFREEHANVSNPTECINRSLYFEAKTFLHGLLVIEDKLTMAHSLEMRVPLLDNDLVDFAMQLPISLKLSNLSEVARLNENDTGNKKELYYKRTNDGKCIFRKTMSRYMPTKITNAVKQGFSAPDASWFKGESIDYVRDTLTNTSARIFEFLDYDTVSTLIDQHISGKQNRRLLIWSLLSVEWYLKEFFQ